MFLVDSRDVQSWRSAVAALLAATELQRTERPAVPNWEVTPAALTGHSNHSRLDVSSGLKLYIYFYL